MKVLLSLVAVARALSSNSSSGACAEDIVSSCPTASCAFCGKSLTGCLDNFCPDTDYDVTLTDCSGGQCHYSCKCRNPQPSPPPAPEPTGIQKKQVTVGGFKCDTIQTATVYWPSDAGSSKKYPLLSFAHGWTEGGPNVAINYQDVIETVAAAGYVVIAEHSGLSLLCYQAEKHDQLRAIEYVQQTQEFADLVDWNSKVGVYGHSMGGAASGLNAADASAVSKYNLGAAVCLHPAQGGDDAATTIPTFYATGSIDGICPPAGVRHMYNLGKSQKIFAEMALADHFECQTREAGIPCPEGWTGYTIHWMNCHIKGMQEDCDAAWAICDGHPETAKKMSACVTDGRPSLVV